MENKKLRLALILVVALVLAVVIAMPGFAGTTEVNLNISCNDTVYEGDNVTFNLTGLNATPISNATINVKMIDANGTVRQYNLTTCANGCADLKLESGGNYTINATYAGSDKFNQTVAVKKIVVLKRASGDESQYYEYDDYEDYDDSDDYEIYYDSTLNVYYDSDGIIVDPDGLHPMDVGSNYQDLVDRAEHIKNGSRD
ncbi:hypothetical protein [Methanobrevibacter sp.]